ncbi:MipA/OmpV family protein [Pedomonas mirosovicensis]|uniref:MipA/OmpV family protein n=1 Tax=Pedomonas mirosovicensis TaxID=2908641 RepID=UPI002169332B|nr:MipA/OmpV family protein [Pedomonas mirosovicensis]MCH8685265.1 MipA/OmpV family protein [Pedomonas mirosovicensis]
MLHPKVQAKVHVPSCVRVAALALAAGLAIGAAPALAEDKSDELSGMVGVGIAAVPDYEGSDDYRILPLPMFDLRYKSFFANFRDGFGAFLLETDKIDVGAGAVFVRGRRAKDSPEGLGKVKDAVGGRVFARYRPIDNMALTAGLTRSFGGTDGTLVDVTANYQFKPSKQMMLIPAVSATWASNKHTQRYFGISAEQSARSGLPAFDADSGLKDVSMSLTGLVALNRHWHLNATAVLTRYLGDAADSPINEHKWQPAMVVGVGYRF